MADDGTRTIALGFPDRVAVRRATELAQRWCAEHPSLAVGVAKMAIGAAVLSWGVHNGAIEMGAHVLGTASAVANPGGLSGTLTGAVAGLTAGKIVGGIGIVGMGGAVGIPAVVLALGGAAVLGALGYAIGDLAYTYVHALRPQDVVLSAGALAVGLALLVDGAREIASDALVRRGVTRVSDQAVELYRTSARVVARSLADLERFKPGAGMAAGAALAGAGGVAAGSVYAASSVTVLGSHALGSFALGVGLVSAPVWPLVLGGVAAGIGGGLLVRRMAASWRQE